MILDDESRLVWQATTEPPGATRRVQPVDVHDIGTLIDHSPLHELRPKGVLHAPAHHRRVPAKPMDNGDSGHAGLHKRLAPVPERRVAVDQLVGIGQVIVVPEADLDDGHVIVALVRVALVVPGGVDASGRRRVIPSLLSFIARLATSYEVVVYVLRYHTEPHSYPLLGATVRDLGSPAGVRRQYAALVRALTRDEPFDVIHGWWALPSGLVAALAGRRLGVPSVVTCDSGEFAAIPDIDYGSQVYRRRRLAVAAAVRLAARVTVCTQYQADLARACRARCEIVPIGVDTSVFVPSSTSEGPPWRLLQVASLNRVKDQPTLLGAFRHVLDTGLDAHLDIVGEDTLNGTVHALADRLGLGTRVTFHGVLTTEQLVPFYHRAHLLVISSRHEAAGVVALEAASCGVPIVGTAVGYLADWTPHRARTVPPRDWQGLGAAIVDVLTDRGARERTRRSAREWTLAHDADWTAHQFSRIYDELSDHGSRGRQR